MDTAGDVELGADDELDADLASREMCLDHAGHRAFVGDGDGPVAESMGGTYQFLGMGRAA